MRRFTKHLSLFMALAILVTIGSVYAQWVYTGTSVGHTSNNLNISMQTYKNEGSQQGYFTRKYNNLMVLLADDYNGTSPVEMGQEGDHIAELAGHGSMIFLFEPYVQTTEAEMDDLTFNIYFEETTPIVYDGVNVFKYTAATNKKLSKVTEDNIDDLNAKYANMNLTDADLGTSSQLGLYYYEITFEHLLSEHIDFTTDFEAKNKIDTLEKWDMLNNAIMSGSVTVTIKDTRDTTGN